MVFVIQKKNRPQAVLFVVVTYFLKMLNRLAKKSEIALKKLAKKPPPLEELPLEELPPEEPVEPEDGVLNSV